MSLLLNRWYDPAVGRWISEDPIGFAGGDANLSRYVGNGVTAATDPSGLVWWPFMFFTEYSRGRKLDRELELLRLFEMHKNGRDIDRQASFRRIQMTGARTEQGAIKALTNGCIQFHVAAGMFITPIGATKMAVEEAVETRTLREMTPNVARARLGMTTGEVVRHQHHVFTEARAIWFKQHFGLDVQKYVVDIEVDLHEGIHGGRGRFAPTVVGDEILRNVAGWWDDVLLQRINSARVAKGWRAGCKELELTIEELENIGTGMVRDILKRDSTDIHPYIK